MKDGQVYVLEANPRASRTVPFVAKATGVPLAMVASRVMVGQTLADLRKEGLLAPDVVGRVPVLDHVSVKEAVLPFDRFPGVDTLLGPEMRSTGEVMGVDITFGLAFAKSQMAAGTRLPDAGTVFLSLADRDKPAGLEVARAFGDLGFSLAATLGTAGYLRSEGVAVDTLVAKVGEEGVASDAVELIAQGKVQLVVNTPRGLGPRADGQHIRTASVVHKVPCLTTLAAARAAAAGIADARSHPLEVRALQDLHPSRVAQRRVAHDGWHNAVSPVPATRRAATLATSVGNLRLANPVMTASGTSGHGTELAAYGALGDLGAVVVKSLSVEPWPGNPAPRVHEVGAGMLNSVGLQGPGLAAWAADDLPALAAAGAVVVVSIWGRSVSDYARAAELVAAAASSDAGGCIVALEVNVSCPNVEDRSRMFAHSAEATAASWRPPRAALPRWAKLSPNVPDLVEIATGAVEGGADGLTLVNTLLGLALDTETGRPGPGRRRRRALGGAVHPVAVRAVWECRSAFPEPADRRGRRRVLGPRRRGAAAGRSRRRPGGHRHLPRPPGAVEGAAPAGALVRRTRHDGGGHPRQVRDRVGGTKRNVDAPVSAQGSDAPATVQEGAPVPAQGKGGRDG